MDINESMIEPVAVVLAAGLSQRMGTPKPALPWRDTTLLGHVVRMTRDELGWATVVVVGNAVQIPEGVISVVNRMPETGIASSLHLGLAAVLQRGKGEPAAVFLADQPFVRAEDAQRTWQKFLEHPDAIAVRPRYNESIGHPVLLRLGRIWNAISQLTGDIGLGKWLTQRQDVLIFDVSVVDRPSPAWDLDTPEEYTKAINLNRQGDNDDDPQPI
ncbi:MAG: nucleotidyltransferase family protein [Firmicutes bacterium]|jgi:molybdenum cofactor cytidylyltransferase|nr:nucleotidyltransferase family protein [Bacillota bacterium]